MLQVQPRGRIFTEEEGEDREDEQGDPHITPLAAASPASDERRRRGDVRINGEPYTIVGVLPQGFEFLDRTSSSGFRSRSRRREVRRQPPQQQLVDVGRLKPGASVAQAHQQIDALNARNLERFPHLKQILINAGFHTVVVPLQDDLVRDIRSTLYLLWGGVVFVLLVGGVNVTNLMLVRSSARMKELATRHALGAGARPRSPVSC